MPAHFQKGCGREQKREQGKSCDKIFFQIDHPEEAMVLNSKQATSCEVTVTKLKRGVETSLIVGKEEETNAEARERKNKRSSPTLTGAELWIGRPDELCIKEERRADQRSASREGCGERTACKEWATHVDRKAQIEEMEAQPNNERGVPDPPLNRTPSVRCSEREEEGNPEPLRRCPLSSSAPTKSTEERPNERAIERREEEREENIGAFVTEEEEEREHEERRERRKRDEVFGLSPFNLSLRDRLFMPIEVAESSAFSVRKEAPQTRPILASFSLEGDNLVRGPVILVRGRSSQ